MGCISLSDRGSWRGCPNDFYSEIIDDLRIGQEIGGSLSSAYLHINNESRRGTYFVRVLFLNFAPRADANGERYTAGV